MRLPLSIGLLLWLTALFGQQTHKTLPVFRELDSLISACKYRETHTLIERTLRNNPHLDKVDKANLYLRLSELHITFGDGDKAMETGIQALSAAIYANDPLLIAETRINLIKAELIFGMGWGEPEYTVEALELAQKHKHNRLLRNIYLIFGTQHFISQDFKEALVFFHKALNISTSATTPGLMAHDQLMISITHLPLGNIDSTYRYINEVKTLSSARHDSINMAKALLTEASVNLALGKMDESKSLIDASMAVSGRLNLPLVYASGITQQMKLSMTGKDYHTAIDLGKKALATLPQNSSYYVKFYVDSLLYASYLGIKDYQSAHLHFVKFVNSQHKFNSRFLSFQSRQIELIQKTREQELTIKNQALKLLGEKRKTSFVIVLNVLFVTLLIVIAIIHILKNRHTRSLFKKEQLISELMDETVQNRSLLLQQQPMTAGFESPETEEATADIDLSHRKLLYEQLLLLLEKEKLYLNPELTRSSLITLLGTNKKYLHQATKYIGKTHLNHILNRYRIREAKKIIETNCAKGRMDLPDNLYMLAGFNSKSSYYRIFKEFTGMTPKDYALECLKK